MSWIHQTPRSDFDAHRPLQPDDDLRLILTWRVQRKVSLSLTLQHDKVIYLLAESPESRALIHRYIDVFEYPDCQIELRADGRTVPCTRYDRLPAIDMAEVVDSKRLGRVLEVAAVLQAQRARGTAPTRLRGQIPARHRTRATARPGSRWPANSRPPTWPRPSLRFAGRNQRRGPAKPHPSLHQQSRPPNSGHPTWRRLDHRRPVRGSRHAAGGQVCSGLHHQPPMRHFYLARDTTFQFGLDIR